MFDPLGDIARALEAWYESLLVIITNVLLQTATPSLAEVSSRFFSVTLGGTFGLAVRVISAIAVVIAFVVLLTPMRNHGMKLGRLFSSMLGVLLFAALFYPVYSLLYGLTQGLTQGVINLATGHEDGVIDEINQIFVGTPQVDVMTKLVSFLLAGSFSYLAMIEVFALRVLLIFVLLFYPIVLALRPLGGLATILFHLCNTAIILVLVCPPLMGFLFLLPVLAGNIIPGATFPLFNVSLTIIGGALAMLTPIVIAIVAFRSSTEVFGAIDARIAGPLAITSMPPITIDDANKDVKEVHASPMKTVIADVVGDGMMHGTLFSDMRGTAFNLAASAAAVAGHPEIGLVIKGGDAVLDRALAKGAKVPDTDVGGE